MAMIRAVPGEEFTRVANALRRVDATLPRQFRSALKGAVKETTTEVKATIRAAPLRRKTTHNRGLRRRLARGVSVRVATGGRNGNAYMRIITAMPPGQEMLARGTDIVKRPNPGWRHPVFGNKDKWVHQGTGYPWFRSTIADNRDDITRDVEKVLEEARDTIARAGGKSPA